jgi:hypothetical protein
MAGADKNISQLTPISTLLSTDLIYIGRASTGVDCYMSASDFINSVLTHPQITKTCAYNTSTTINVGACNTYRAVTLNCTFIRYYSVRHQIITIFTNYPTSSNIGLNPGNYEVIYGTSEDLGITLSVLLTDGQMQLIVSVDNSTANNVIMDYVVLSSIAV